MKKLINIPNFKIDLGGHLKEKAMKNLSEVLNSGKFTTGKFVEACEEEIKQQTGAKEAVVVSSGSAALEASAFALKDIFGTGKILVPDNTFVATALAFERQGFEVDFYQNGINKIDLTDDEIDGYKGVVVVDIGGIIPSNLKSFVKRCNKLSIWVCEDAAQAYGSTLKGQAAGTFGNVGIYSFFGTKVVTSGEGGAVVSRSAIVSDDTRRFRDFGKLGPWISYYIEKGWNGRMNEFSAAVLLPQLEITKEIVLNRKLIADTYYSLLDKTEGITLLPKQKKENCFNGYKVVAFLDEEISKVEFVKRCEDQGVAFQGSVYDIPLTRQPVYKGKTTVGGRSDIPDTQRMLCLPSYLGMKKYEIEYVVKVIKEVLRETL